MGRTRLRCCAALSLLSIWACTSRPPGTARPFPPPDAELVTANEALGDPYGGRFPFDAAIVGLPQQGTLRATLITDEGDVACVLEPDHAPLAVANFVGLARGKRPFRDSDGAWRTAAYYDGVPWHRAYSGEFVQTGRRGRVADGGFLIQDETALGDAFDRPGIMAMAGIGEPDTASVQFFVTTASARHLDGFHTIFGRCDGEAVLRRLERRVLDGERPLLRRVVIERS